ncbi:hypothetical protein ABT354_11765 [Streptomyces sp. NPDC000594]|uniref:hypothetical protein n=1 Tax=Streptomyces sp. NPDC000594 TaxID=3154261 RepID=UPI00331BC666
MASLVHFRKVSESEESVEYLFGFDGREERRRLVMDVHSRRARPSDGKVDYEFLKSSRRINALYVETGRWPERGMSAS